jgi:nitrogen fixation protein FixH
VATVVVGARVREETVVARPYEDGLRHDAERGARAALGLEVRLAGAAPEAGEGPIAFELIDGAGRPVDDAAVTLELSRPDTSRDTRAAAARAGGSGRWSAALAFPAAGPWDVRFDVVRGGDRVRLERRVHVQAPCDLGAGPCTRPLEGGGEVTLELSPRPLAPMRELAVAARVRGAPGAEGAAVAVSFAMAGMDMGPNEVRLAPAGGGRHAGKAVLVRCPSGREEWTAEVRVERPGAPARTARFRLAVRE